MDYPSDFSTQAKARIELARVEAKETLSLAKATKTDYRNPAGPALDYIATVFHAYAKETCELGRFGTWDIDRVRKEAERVMAGIVSEAEVECRHLDVDVPIFALFGDYGLSQHFWIHFKKMPAWKSYQASLGEVAKIQSGDPPQSTSRPEDAPSKSADDPPTVISERSDRRQLLKEYKEATGNPSNRKIYMSKNSGIHKPEFYDWINGRLSSESATTKNFERFLREKRPPIARGSTD